MADSRPELTNGRYSNGQTERPRFNLNTVGIGIAIAVAIITPLIVQGQNNTKFELLTAQLVDANRQTVARMDALDADRKASRASYESQLRDLVTALTKQSAESTQTGTTIGQLQKSDENTDARLNRMADVYNERFDDLNAHMNKLDTSIALAQQSLDEIKAYFGVKPAVGSPHR